RSSCAGQRATQPLPLQRPPSAAASSAALDIAGLNLSEQLRSCEISDGAPKSAPDQPAAARVVRGAPAFAGIVHPPVANGSRVQAENSRDFIVLQPEALSISVRHAFLMRHDE
ncbi:MAG: hypothetical protein RMK33_00170, partial [Arcobacter sp.]|nr:hypothetical protein [Bryobacteraceae bacterium]MDW8434562.1 hypothetical protein [Arcobacter sp.]